MKPPAIVSFGPRPVHRSNIALATASVMAGSIVTTVPLVATVPFLPPLGLLMLLGWRLRRPDVFPAWAGLPLGLFDDLFSGQPFGSGIAFWTLCLIAVDVLDTRLVWRDFWQDWLIASGAIGACLIATRLFASPLTAHVDALLLFQILASVALFPAAASLCARIDGRRRPIFE